MPGLTLHALHTAAVATANGTALDVQQYPAVGVQVEGITSATITFEVTIDGSTWYAALASNLTTGLVATTATADGMYQVPTVGPEQMRARISTYVSGTITVTAVVAKGVISPFLYLAVNLLDENGAAYGVKHVENKPRVSSMPYLYDIAEGVLAGHVPIRRFGHNPVVAAAWETVHDVSDLRTYLTAAERLQIASDDTDDDGDPVGNVLTDASFLRVFNLTVVTAGSSGYNEGTITASNNADNAVLDQIDPVENVSNNACFTVPAGKTAYIVQAMATEASTKGSQFGFWLRPSGGLWAQKRTIVLLDSNIVLPIPVPMKIPAQSDIEIRAYGILAGANVTAGFEGWYE